MSKVFNLGVFRLGDENVRVMASAGYAQSKDRDEALKELLDRGLLVQEQNVGEGRSGVTYRAA